MKGPLIRISKSKTGGKQCLESRVNWLYTPNAGAPKIIATCHLLNITVETDNREELVTELKLQTAAFLEAKLQKNTLDSFLRRKGWIRIRWDKHPDTVYVFPENCTVSNLDLRSF